MNGTKSILPAPFNFFNYPKPGFFRIFKYLLKISDLCQTIICQKLKNDFGHKSVIFHGSDEIAIFEEKYRNFQLKNLKVYN